MNYCRTCDRYLAEDASVAASEIAAAEKRGRDAMLTELRTWANEQNERCAERLSSLVGPSDEDSWLKWRGAQGLVNLLNKRLAELEAQP